MKEYKNYCNKKLIFLFYYHSIISVISLFISFKVNSYYNEFLLIIFLITLISIELWIITGNYRERYVINDEGITRKKVLRTFIPWQNIMSATITPWYVGLKSINGFSMKIIKQKGSADSFEDIRMEVLAHLEDEIIEFKPSINEETLVREGSLRLLFIYLLLQFILATTIILFIVNIIGAVGINDVVYNSYNILIIVVQTIWAILIIIKYLKNKVVTKKHIVALFWYMAGTTAMSRILESVLIKENIMLLTSISVVISFVVFVLQVLIIIEYLRTSNRVKHYFIK